MYLKLDSLINTGVLQINEPLSDQPEKTVIVLGAPRGGTTMVASVLKTLGVYMGESLGPVVEDVQLSLAVENSNNELIDKIIKNRNSKYKIWGWKRPMAIKHFNVWKDSFRNPYIIVIFRDPLAVANRNRISVLADIYQNMESTIDHYSLIVSIIKKLNFPILLCSYEKALLNPLVFIKSLDCFLDLNVPHLHAIGVDAINPGSIEYLNNSRITNSIGFLEILNEEFCSGWVFYKKSPQRVVKVEIFYKGVLIDTVQADNSRAGLKKNGTHPTGLCGFKYYWPQDIKPFDFKLLDIKAQGDIKTLKLKK